MKKAILPLALLFLFAVELLRIWFLMPFPGSQETSMAGFAYFMHRNAWWMRLLLYVLIGWQVFRLAIHKKRLKMFLVLGLLLVYGGMAYFFMFRLDPQRMFKMQQDPVYATAADNKVSMGKLVIGVVIEGEARAYPIEIIGYHHQVRDVVGRKEIMVTYCTLCRSGRVFDPVVDGQMTHFKLIGIDQYNAIFEDELTGSWWQQATGESITGPAKGTTLEEIPSAQMTLQAWLNKYPDSRILQADDAFLKQYGQLTGYDEGTTANELEGRDAMPWQDKSWVLTVNAEGTQRAYDWGELLDKRIMQDTINGVPVLLTIEQDNKTFHAFDRRVGGRQLDFVYTIDPKQSNSYFVDAITNTPWDFTGKCIAGELLGTQLKPIPVYQEFYHTYKSFRK